MTPHFHDDTQADTQVDLAPTNMQFDTQWILKGTESSTTQQACTAQSAYLNVCAQQLRKMNEISQYKPRLMPLSVRASLVHSTKQVNSPSSTNTTVLLYIDPLFCKRYRRQSSQAVSLLKVLHVLQARSDENESQSVWWSTRRQDLSGEAHGDKITLVHWVIYINGSCLPITWEAPANQTVKHIILRPKSVS